MLSQLQVSYQRVEQSLDRLTESIAAYNPSVSAADELLAADEAVNKDLDRLITHQSNHVRLEDLRQTTKSLDDTLRKTIQLLADTRKEILAIPSASASEEAKREVGVEELLAYAKFISKTTVAPTARRQETLPVNIKTEEGVAQITNGIATPPAGGQDHGTDGSGVKAVDAGMAMLYNGFVPWPSQELLQAGALGSIQRMIESGQDPAGVLTVEEQAELDRRKKEEEEKAKAVQEEAERRRMSMFDGAVRRQTTDVFDPDNL